MPMGSHSVAFSCESDPPILSPRALCMSPTSICAVACCCALAPDSNACCARRSACSWSLIITDCVFSACFDLLTETCCYPAHGCCPNFAGHGHDPGPLTSIYPCAYPCYCSWSTIRQQWLTMLTRTRTNLVVPPSVSLAIFRPGPAPFASIAVSRS